MPTLTRKFAPEFYAQGLLYFPMMLFYFLGIIFHELPLIALILQLFVGFFQVISGLIHALSDRSTIHRKYLFSVILYFVVFGVSASIFSSFIGDIGNFLMVIVIPLLFAAWYMNMLSWYYAGRYEQEELPISQEDVLDDLMVKS